MDFNAPGLENRIVRLHTLEADHKCLLEKTGAIDAMWNWLPVLGSGTSYEAYFDKVMTGQKRGNLHAFVITRVDDGAFAGVSAFLDPSRTHRRVRIGYNWHPKAMRGTGIFPATQLAMIQRALDCRVRRIEWTVGERNTRAVAAYERIGAKREGTLRNYFRLSDGDWANLVVFSLLSEEAGEAIRRLESQLGFE